MARPQLPLTPPTQWAIDPTGNISASNPTTPHITAGAYDVRMTPFGQIHFAPKILQTDEIMILPDSPTARAITSIRSFWGRAERYAAFRILHKRGLFFYGPPGTGKTAAINLLTQELIEMGGVVLYPGPSAQLISGAALMIRAIEPQRPLIFVLEDIEEIIEYEGDRLLTSVLDGENQISNVVYIATTNQPEKIPARLFNRPSRFDEVVLVGAPSAAQRRAFLRELLARAGETPLSTTDELRWLKDTEDLSISHLRELIVGVYCLGQNYPEVLTRLQAMKIKPVALPGWAAEPTQRRKRMMAVTQTQVMMEAPDAPELTEEEAKAEEGKRLMAQGTKTSKFN